MKCLVIFLYVFVFIASVCCNICADNGKPECTKVAQIGKTYRNFWDPTRFWRCTALSQEPQVEKCPSQQGYLASVGRCVPWVDWIWEPPICEDFAAIRDLDENTIEPKLY